MAIGAHWPAYLRKVPPLHVFLGSPRRRRARRWLAGHGIRKHHRLLGYKGSVHGDGACMCASLWGKEVEFNHPGLPKDTAHTLAGLHTNCIFLAQHEDHSPEVGAGPAHRISC